MSLQSLVITMMQEFSLVAKDDVDKLFEKYLKIISSELEAKNSGLIVYNHKKTNMTCLVSYVTEGEDFKDKVKKKRTLPYVWMMSQFENQFGFHFKPDEWPEIAKSEYRMFKKWGCPAVICVPIVQNEVKGYCFWGRQEAASWDRNDLLALKQIANIFGIGLKRRG
ncbi:MAG: hypothetical protein KC471_01345 [Flavobacteriaceae bacterium]|nr:hypothetical protein [Flavobacteriaceae bacterium]